jgi:carbonic anhydrase
LKQAEATRRLIKENYSHVAPEDLLPITVAENVLTQLENLNTYPIIRSRLHQGRLSLHGWVYSIETGQVLTYDPSRHDFVSLEERNSFSDYVYNLYPSCSVGNGSAQKSEPQQEVSNPNLPQSNRLSVSQAERIYRGSYH